jgi:hypothetical protein
MQKRMYKKGDKVIYIKDDEDIGTVAEIGKEYTITEVSSYPDIIEPDFEDDCCPYLLADADGELVCGWCSDEQIKLVEGE